MRRFRGRADLTRSGKDDFLKRRPRIKQRITSLASAFVQAVIPRHDDERSRRLLYVQAGIKEDECAYCGERASDTDHFRALVKGGRPSGYFHTADNLIPSCGRCNQSKSGAHWRDWIISGAVNSPMTRGIADLDERILRLTAFEALGNNEAMSPAEMRQIVGPQEWDDYWSRLDRIRAELAAADVDALVIYGRLSAAVAA